MNLSDRPMLAGRRILVTGGASGIGAGAARLFQTLGAAVFVTDVNGPALETAAGAIGTAGSLAGDVTSEADCEAMASAAMAAMGGLDGLFHCAGVADRIAKVHAIEVETWQRIVDINLRGTFLIVRAVGRHLLAAGGGAIVTMSSINGLNGIPRRHAYGPAKAAVAMLTRNLACEWGARGIRVNALAPGYIRTPMVAELIDAGKIDVARIEARTPMRRFGEVDEVARAAAFLLSDLASFITGAVLSVDGGWAAFGGAGEVDTA